MFVTIGGNRFDFSKIDVDVQESGIENAFAKFDKMTLAQLITQKKYEHLKIDTETLHPQLLDKAAGQAVQIMKDMGDPYYKQFLNNYGDMKYSKFVVRGNEELLQKNGVYIIIVGNELVFSGVCARSFRERFNQHIGNISAKGCFRDGTATHCHINAQITKKIDTCKVYFSICPMNDKKEMNRLKNAIIKRFEPEWNLRTSKDKMEYLSNY
ncbi:hypothetical protein [Solibacillus sp. FSL H8-0538]|uniref:hypothetical protein n=1 Tax=Solibacillus sp. FSL H8-0538 TaxID=2921400 RepID=UPI0030FD19CA